MIKGVDISSYQANLDVRTLTARGVDFAIFKLSEGRTWVDKCFDRFYAQAFSIGLPVGAYVFSRATTADAARKEASFALSLLKGRALPLGVFLDVEAKEQLALSSAELVQIIGAFCSEIRAAGYRCGVYGSAGQLWAKVSPRSFGDAFVWAASWGAQPRIECDLWQYTDHMTIGGYSGPVDGDYAMSARFEALVKSNPQDEPQPVTEPEKPKDDDAAVDSAFTLSGVPVLRIGDTGDAVKALQGELIAYGYSCGGKRDWRGAEKPDGIFGNVTAESVRSFQRAHNLSESGVADKKTRSALLGVIE